MPVWDIISPKKTQSRRKKRRKWQLLRACSLWAESGHLSGAIERSQEYKEMQKEMSNMCHIVENTNFSLQSSMSAEQCKFLRKDSPQLEKHTFSLKENVVYLEGDLVSTANTHSNNSERSLHLNIGSSMSEHLKFKNEGQNSQYTQFEGSVSRKSLFFQQKIFALHSTMYSVDDNGRDVVQPSLFNVRHDIANTEQLSTCNKISQALSKSSSPSNYKGIYGGLRRYSSNQTGYKVEGESNLKKHQGPESSHRDSKSNKCRNIS
ncbi:hypothetical protein Celaphus_00013965 [Cervus elaphus hippelaphus]|uniref:Uncharacterized protein n=1 Tax=Cervus elaphus hippelaphus TaxID=46360 RepID=A0A212CCK6_CEREH|nr:hypothetical protein Celaphus_00013965 [Cervus elaphus hippelaphus]